MRGDAGRGRRGEREAWRRGERETGGEGGEGEGGVGRGRRGEREAWGEGGVETWGEGGVARTHCTFSRRTKKPNFHVLQNSFAEGRTRPYSSVSWRASNHNNMYV
ncbi:hypothetical protein CesoFtcFv8_000034 [Champsocephalus esox]|uniref:Uncharacterized protein n=1 Tax=Champsocephalus esox TaxID=159716 RepID=A0AAN8I553_9TELE|nr:hypothetical protein CesoFtcFv8_000034 [Champsocephalus esox]